MNTWYGNNFDNAEDMWNESSQMYEANFNGKDYMFEPDLIGHQNNIVIVKVHHPDYNKPIEMRYDPYYEEWLEINDSEKEHHCCLYCDAIDIELYPLLEAAVKKCRCYDNTVVL